MNNEIHYFVHPTACVDAGAMIGDGSKIWHYAHISSGSRMGRSCILGQNTFVAEGAVLGSFVKVQNNVAIYAGTTIEDYVFLGPSCVLTNVTNPRAEINRHALYEKLHIRRGATLCANATIICGITIGRYAFIAAGAVVTRNVPDYGLMMGVPARQVGWMSRHGHILKNPDDGGVMICPESGLRYKANGDGELYCLDLNEEAALPEHFCLGNHYYDEYKQTGDRG